MKSCQYRNCEKLFDNKSNQKYCNIRCKHNEVKYIQRETNRLKGESKHIKDLIKEFEEVKMDDKLIELYKNIYR